MPKPYSSYRSRFSLSVKKGRYVCNIYAADTCQKCMGRVGKGPVDNETFEQLFLYPKTSISFYVGNLLGTIFNCFSLDRHILSPSPPPPPFFQKYNFF